MPYWVKKQKSIGLWMVTFSWTAMFLDLFYFIDILHLQWHWDITFLHFFLIFFPLLGVCPVFSSYKLLIGYRIYANTRTVGSNQSEKLLLENWLLLIKHIAGVQFESPHPLITIRGRPETCFPIIAWIYIDCWFARPSYLIIEFVS